MHRICAATKTLMHPSPKTKQNEMECMCYDFLNLVQVTSQSVQIEKAVITIYCYLGVTYLLWHFRSNLGWSAKKNNWGMSCLNCFICFTLLQFEESSRGVHIILCWLLCCHIRVRSRWQAQWQYLIEGKRTGNVIQSWPLQLMQIWCHSLTIF